GHEEREGNERGLRSKRVVPRTAVRSTRNTRNEDRRSLAEQPGFFLSKGQKKGVPGNDVVHSDKVIYV
ncbi:hypothetical protein, partial [Spirochaeta dissipatitropha]